MVVIHNSKTKCTQVNICVLKLCSQKYQFLIDIKDSHFLRFLKVALCQKILMHLSFPQTGKPYYLPGLEF